MHTSYIHFSALILLYSNKQTCYSQIVIRETDGLASHVTFLCSCNIETLQRSRYTSVQYLLKLRFKMGEDLSTGNGIRSVLHQNNKTVV